MASTASISSSNLPQHSGRDLIVDVAAQLFFEQGYKATSMRDIAEHAGMKAGSLYYHFSAKAAILEAVLHYGIDVMEAAFADAASDARAQQAVAGDRLTLHVRAHLGALFEHGPFTAAHFETFRTAPSDVHATILTRRDAYEALWTALLTELSTTDISVSLARLSLFGAMNATIDWYDPQRGNLDRVARAISQQFWFGFSTTHGAGGA